MTYCAKIKTDREGNHIVTFPMLPSCHTYGENRRHAKAMAKEVLEGWLLTHKQIGNPIPKQRKHKCDDCIEIKLSPKVKAALGQ